MNSEYDAAAEEREASFVRRSVDGFRYITDHVQVHRSGDVWRGLCPFHVERTPSFVVYPANSRRSRGYASFFCYGCRKGGDVVQFAMLLHGLPSRRAAMKHLEAEHGLQYGEDEQLNELRLALMDENDEGPERAVVDPTEVCFTCAVAVRRLLRRVQAEHPDRLDTLFAEADRFNAYLDHELRERTAAAAAGLVDEAFAWVDARWRALSE